MAFLLDDDWDNDPRVVKAGTAAFGLYSRCGMWVARHLTDGFVPAGVAASYGTREWAAKLVEVGLWTTVGSGFQIADYLALNPSAEKVKERRSAWARKAALFRDPDLRRMVRDRDRDMCRYCGTKVRWHDRRGSRGGTYDHVDPAGPNTLENLVVACRGCNSSKRDRTPEQAGMGLLPVPDLDTTQNGSKSNLGSHRAFSTTPKGVGGLFEPHPYDQNGHECSRCPLPETHPVHRAAGTRKRSTEEGF